MIWENRQICRQTDWFTIGKGLSRFTERLRGLILTLSLFFRSANSVVYLFRKYDTFLFIFYMVVYVNLTIVVHSLKVLTVYAMTFMSRTWHV